MPQYVYSSLYQPRGFWVMYRTKKPDPTVEDSTSRLVIWYKMILTDPESQYQTLALNSYNKRGRDSSRYLSILSFNE